MRRLSAKPMPGSSELAPADQTAPNESTRRRPGKRVVAVALAVSLLLCHCGSSDDDAANAPHVGPTSCGPLPVAPDTVEPIELLFGATNVNAALGDGGLTAGFSSCGELTVMKWPGPSYYDQIDYLSSNGPGARLEQRHGALETQGAFAGISYRTSSGEEGAAWLRDPVWEHRQRYSADDSNVLVHDSDLSVLGLRVRAHYFVLPDRDVLVSRYTVERAAQSPVTEARLLYYANYAPTLQRLPLFPVADWALDFQNDFAAVYDDRERAVLHFVTAASGNRNFSPLNELLREPPGDAGALQSAVDVLIDSLQGQGAYIAIAPATPRFDFQIGFDDAPICEHQSEASERTLAGLGLPPELESVARLQFVCGATLPEGPLQRCRDANGWSYEAQSAFDDALDGRLSGSPIAACRANVALSQPLDFDGEGVARAVVYTAAASTKDQAYRLLRAARGVDPDRQRDQTEQWWRDYLSTARLPDTDDARVTAFAKRALISLRTATDRASGAIVASVTTQPPYGADWPRDGAFINHALDEAGFTSVVGRHNRFYARVQRKEPESWSVFYSFPPCNPAEPKYPDCIPAGTVEMNYYADPDLAVPAGPNSFEIDEAALTVWTLWNHVGFIENAVERDAYLSDVCPAIYLGAVNLASCRDPDNGLQCFANEDDNVELTQGLQGAETVLLALDSAVAAADACGFAAGDTAAWQRRAEELRSAILARFLVPGPPPHLRGARRAWALWPVGVFAYDDPLAASHAASLRDDLDPVLTRSAQRAGYNAQALLARAVYFRAVGDEAALAETRDQVRYFVRELTTPDTLHMAEFYVRVDADLNGDGVAPDYLQSNGVPHVWEQSFLYNAALEAFGAR